MVSFLMQYQTFLMSIIGLCVFLTAGKWWIFKYIPIDNERTLINTIYNGLMFCILVSVVCYLASSMTVNYAPRSDVATGNAVYEKMNSNVRN